MKTSALQGSQRHILRLLTPIATLLGAWAVCASSLPYVNETFDPPSLPLDGWQNPELDGAIVNLSREYVAEGVAGSIAVKISAEFENPGAYLGTGLYQKQAVAGNRLATLQNTVLTFDLKTDRPDLKSVRVGLQSWADYAGWSGSAYASIAVIPIGPYAPGQFKQIRIALDDPLWVIDPEYPDPGNLAGPFLPSGKTLQIWIQVDGSSFPPDALYPLQFSLTVDNVRLTNQNPMVRWQSSGNALLTLEGNAYKVVETGIAEHLGNYTETVLFNEQGIGAVEIKAANGDTLVGTLYMTSFAELFPDILPGQYYPTEVGVDLEDGTGRFQGAKGNFVGILNWSDPASFTSAAFGSITTVGTDKK